MAGEKNRSTLGDYFTLQRGTTYKSRLLDQPGPVLLGLATIHRNGGFRSDSLRTYGGESPAKLLVQPGELYLSLKDVTQSADLLGAVARLPTDHSAGRLTQDTVKLEPISKDVPADYLYWLLRTPQYRSYCRSHATGTTNLGLAREDFLAFPAPEPTSTQLTITRILDTLDDKIEMNRRMNETLEEMARAIFKSWFVDFDPVRAKADGRDPGLPEHIADLFPDRFEDSELGEIPAGWDVMPIGDAVRVVGGGTPSTKEPAFWEGGIHCWATPKDLSKLQDPILLDTERKVTDAGLAKISSGLLPTGTVLLSSRAPVGYLAVARVPVSVNQGFIALVCEGPLTNHYALHWALSNMEQIEGREVAIEDATMVRTIDRMERDGLVWRKRNPRDRRQIKIFLTEKGSALRDTLVPEAIAGNRSALRGLSEDEQRQLRDLLGRVIGALEETPAAKKETRE